MFDVSFFFYCITPAATVGVTDVVASVKRTEGIFVDWNVVKIGEVFIEIREGVELVFVFLKTASTNCERRVSLFAHYLKCFFYNKYVIGDVLFFLIREV